MDDTAITWREYQRSRDEVAYQTRLSVLSGLDSLLVAPRTSEHSDDFYDGFRAAIEAMKHSVANF
jgi:hypothetical protein